MRRPFSRQQVEERPQKIVQEAKPVNPLPLPTPLSGAAPPRREDGITPKHRYTSFDSRRLEAAKQVLESAGIDPSILDKLVERIKSIDEEIEDLEEEVSITKRRIHELEEEKDRIYKILSKFLAE